LEAFMCRNRLSPFQAKLLTNRCRNLVWHGETLTEADALQLLAALEDALSDRETRLRRRWAKRWSRLRIDLQ
jgi:hypothetical protein